MIISVNNLKICQLDNILSKLRNIHQILKFIHDRMMTVKESIPITNSFIKNVFLV